MIVEVIREIFTLLLHPRNVAVKVEGGGGVISPFICVTYLRFLRIFSEKERAEKGKRFTCKWDIT